MEDFRDQLSVCILQKDVKIVVNVINLTELHEILHATSLQLRELIKRGVLEPLENVLRVNVLQQALVARLFQNMLRKTGDLAARTARWAAMLPSAVLIWMSVWMLSDNIRPRDIKAVAFDSFSLHPSAQIEQSSLVCNNGKKTLITPQKQTRSIHPLAHKSGEVVDPPLGEARSGLDAISGVGHPREGESRGDFMDAIENPLQR
nr:hypothetical protein AT1G55755 [Ipomoea batatas]